MALKPYAFFYGGYMDADTLRGYGTTPENCETGYVKDMALTVGPLANLEPKHGARAYGLLARLTHEDLNKLYGDDPSALKGIAYLPEAMLVQRDTGAPVPAITYICEPLSGGPPSKDYVANLVKAAEKLSLPSDYVAHIRSFIDPSQ